MHVHIRCNYILVISYRGVDRQAARTVRILSQLKASLEMKSCRSILVGKFPLENLKIWWNKKGKVKRLLREREREKEKEREREERKVGENKPSKREIRLTQTGGSDINSEEFLGWFVHSKKQGQSLNKTVGRITSLFVNKNFFQRDWPELVLST